MATGALLIAPAPAAPAPGEFVQFVGFCYVHLIMWGLCSYLTKETWLFTVSSETTSFSLM